MKICVDVKTLKDKYPETFSRAYEQWVSDWWTWDRDNEWYKDGLNQTPWLDVDAVYYSVAYCQSDYAFFTGRVMLDKFLDEFDKDNEYFVLREAMKLDDCADALYIEMSPTRNSSARFNEIEWRGIDDGWFEEDDVLGHNDRTTSVLEGMNYRDYYDICMELMGDLYTWIKEVGEQRMNKLYYEIRDDIEYQTSEESFIENAWCNDMQFEVEVDDENIRNDPRDTGTRLAA